MTINKLRLRLGLHSSEEFLGKELSLEVERKVEEELKAESVRVEELGRKIMDYVTKGKK